MIYAPEHLEHDRRPAVTCPDCQGEAIIHRNRRRDPATGTWVSDETPCTTCQHTGAVPADDAVVCRWCPTSIHTGTHCPEHDDLCDDHRPHSCGDCADQ